MNAETRRNVCFIGHSGSGKTSVAEAILFSAHITTRIGKTLDNSSHFDFEPEEVKRGTSLKTSVFDFVHQGVSISLIDTPGSSSFLGDTLCALRAADAAVLVVSGSSGLKVQGEKAWDLAVKENLSRAVFVTELDKERAQFEKALEAVKTTLEITPVVVQIPIGAEAQLSGVVDLLSMTAYITGKDGTTNIEPIGKEILPAAQEARTRMIESIAETNDGLLERYLSGEKIADDELLAAFISSFQEQKLIPVFCGSAVLQVGITAFIDALIKYFPSPLARAPYQATTADGETVSLAANTEEPFTGIVFKTFADPFIGHLSLVRVISGCLKSDVTVYNPNTETAERVGKLHLQYGKEHKPVDEVGAGSIVSLSKLKDTRTGHTLCDQKHPRILRGFDFPESCMTFAIEPKSKGDEDKIFGAVEKIMMEDPSIQIKRDQSSHETIISGVSQNHIEITLERIKRKFNVEVLLHAPKIPYRETLRRKAEAQGKHKKQSGGRGQFGDCWLRLSPRRRGEGYLFKNEIFGGSIPKNYVPAVEKGVVEAMTEGVLAGYQMVDIECAVYDGSYHPVDSSDLAFKLAALKGFKAAAALADPVLLEPIMTVEITVPDDITGNIIGDINSRRGKVLGMDQKTHAQLIHAEVPLSEMLSYAADLRAMTADRGSFHMEFHTYEEVPGHLMQRVIDEIKSAAADAAAA